jgi:hypothetical protein
VHRIKRKIRTAGWEQYTAVLNRMIGAGLIGGEVFTMRLSGHRTFQVKKTPNPKAQR